MGIWDAITAPFTGKPIEEAAAARAAALGTGFAQQGQLYGQGRDALTSQYGAGRGAATDYYTRSLEPYTSMQPYAMGGYGAYADASGAMGRAGQERAQANFMTDPGVIYAQNQQIDSMNRTANARGVSVGTNIKDVMDYVNANSAKQYGSYVDRLAPWLGQGQAIAAGMGGINTGLGSLLNQNFTGLGGALGSSFTGQGDAAMRAATGIGDAQAQGLMAPMAAGQNIWNAGLNLAKTAMGAGMFGGGGGGGAFAPGTNFGGTGGASPWRNPDQSPLLGIY